jgi:hypothetical protein
MQRNEVVAFLIFDKIKSGVVEFIVIDYMASDMTDCGLGSKLIEELKLFGNNKRFS